MDYYFDISETDARALLNVLKGQDAYDDDFALSKKTMTTLFVDSTVQRLELFIKECGDSDE